MAEGAPAERTSAVAEGGEFRPDGLELGAWRVVVMSARGDELSHPEEVVFRVRGEEIELFPDLK